MTWALCLNCGEVKFGAICPCPKCQVSSTGDMNLDIAFSDHRMSKQSLEEFGKVVTAIRAACSDDELCFWSFIRYVSTNHAEILGVNLEPEMQLKCDQLLRQARVPEVTVHPPPREKSRRKGKSKSRWWPFGKSDVDQSEEAPE